MSSIHNEPCAFRGLEELLYAQGIRVSRVRHCAEARSTLKEAAPVDLVLTDVTLDDGTWRDVIQLVRELAKDTPVIVMSRVVSMSLYLDTQDAGAVDFIVPPMTAGDLVYVLTTAVSRTVVRQRVRRATTRTALDQRSQPTP